MYKRNNICNNEKFKPFYITCGNCNSHNVTVFAYDHMDLEIRCNSCGSYLDVGKYNETTYVNED